MTAQIQRLQNQVNSLQQRITELENQTKNFIHAYSGQKKAPEDIKSIQQGDSTLELKKGANLTHSESDDLLPYQAFTKVGDIESDKPTEASKRDENITKLREGYHGVP